MNREEMLGLLGRNKKAVMTTIGRDGTPHSVPVLYALDADVVLISGTQGRARTNNLRRDPRCVVTVFDDGDWFKWVTVQGTVQLRTEDAVAENARLYTMITGKPPENMDEYREAMIREKRLVYALSIERWYPSGD
ncbi:MAG TPA: PPOX class F420-dependent oxidoreductase [Actinomycetota bacterium]|nr:PPOX class F420-dependent oxidoreductase [Actinomycetota bacterium]